MTLDELKVQVANDLKVNDERLDTESLKNQELYTKYLDTKSNFELLMYNRRLSERECAQIENYLSKNLDYK